MCPSDTGKLAAVVAGKSLRDDTERLAPSRGHELAVLANEGFGEPILFLHELVAEEPARTELLPVDALLAVGHYSLDAAAALLDVDLHVAAHSTEGADRVHALEEPRSCSVMVRGIEQRTDRAHLDAQPAGHARTLLEVLTERGVYV